MKNLKWLPLFLLCSIAGISQSTITIKGNIINDLEGYNTIYFHYKGDPMDSVEVKNGNFEIVMPFKKGETPWLTDEYNKTKLKRDWYFNFLFEHPGTITVKDMDLNYGFKGAVTGVQSAVDYVEFNILNENNSSKIYEEVQKKYPVAPEYPKDAKDITPEFTAYYDYFSEIRQKYDLITIVEFIRNHPDSYASVYLLDMEMRNMDVKEIKKNYALLSKKRQNSDEGKEIPKYIKALQSSVANNKIKDFVLLGPDGKKVSSKSLRGKYVLIDFWASWCSPCIAEFPNFKNLYEKYKDKNFEILGISADKNSQAWHKALKKHELPWIQTIDGKDSQADNFAVSSYPTTFLIDPEGKIIMRDGNIEEKLHEIFGY